MNPYERAKRASELEASIESLEIELVDLSRQLDDASLAHDADTVRSLGVAYARAEAALEAALEAWGSLTE